MCDIGSRVFDFGRNFTNILQLHKWSSQFKPVEALTLNELHCTKEARLHASVVLDFPSKRRFHFNTTAVTNFMDINQP